MANDDELLAFEITDQDLANEFNFDLRRPRQSKNRATYGIWAEDSDEEADARPAFGSGGAGAAGFARKPGTGNYSAPVGFVSAGIQKVLRGLNSFVSGPGGGGGQVVRKALQYSSY